MKKIIVYVIVLMMILQLQPFSVYASQEKSEDLRDKYNSCVEMLAGIGLVDNIAWSGLGVLEGVTRAEAAEVVAKILLMPSDSPALTTDIFADVSKTHPQANAIALVSGCGLLKGENDNFRPDALLTYDDAMGVISELLGYSQYALRMEMTPIQKELLLKQAGLYDDLDYRQGAGITKGDFAILLAHGLETEMIYQTSFGDRVYSFDTSDNPILMTKYMDIEILEGVIRANKNTSLYQKDGLGIDAVMIDDMLCYNDNKKTSQLLGHRVLAYVKKNEDDKNATLLYAKSYETSVLNISPGNLMTDAKEFSLQKLVYFDSEKNKKRTAQISVLADYIYNERMCLSLIPSDLKFKSGMLTLVDNDEDGEYDVLFIQRYENYVVQSVDMPTETIFDKLGRSVVLHEEDMILERPDGKSFKLSSLIEWCVLSVFADKDGKAVKAILSNDKVQGEVTSISDGKVYSIFGGEETREAEIWCEEGTAGAKLCSPVVGSEGVFYLDYSEKLVAVSPSRVVTEYGFLLGAKRESSMSDKVVFRIVTREGNCADYYVGKNGISVNNYSGDEPRAKGEQLISLFSENGVFVQQVIQYTVNADGRLTKLNKATSPSGALGFDDEKFTLDAVITSGAYDRGQNGIGFVNFFDSESVIFLLNKGDSATVREEDVTVCSSVALRGKFNNIHMYDNDAVKVAAACSMELSSTGELMYTAAVFDRMVTRINDDGEEEPYAYFMESGKATGCFVEQAAVDSLTRPMEKGECFLYFYNVNGKISSFRRFNTEAGSPSFVQYLSGTGIDAALSAYYGTVFGMTDQRLSLDVNGTLYSFKSNNSMNIYLIENAAQKTFIDITKRSSIFYSPENPEQRSRVMIVARRNVIYDMFVIR